jgi:hypothetical protein
MSTTQDGEDDSKNTHLERVAAPGILAGADHRTLTRRSVLKSLAAIPLAAAAITLSPLAAVVTAEVVTVVVAVVGIVLALVRMFGKSGPGIADLLNVQVQLLLNITAQLENVQRGIELILTRLDDLERVIGKIPVRTVEAINKHRILGISRLYREKLDAFHAVRRHTGLLSKAQERYGADLKASIVHPLQEARADLMSVDSVFNVPFIGMAFQMEIHSLVMAGADRQDLEPVLRSYRTWFVQTRTALSSQIFELRTRRTELRATLRHLNGFRSACAANKEKTLKGRPGRYSRALGDYVEGNQYHYYTASGQLAEFSYPLKTAELADLKKQDLDDLLTLSPLTIDDLPMVVLPTATSRTDFWVEDNGGARKSNNPAIPLDAIPQFVEQIQYCPKDGPLAAPPEVQPIAKEMHDSGMSLVSLTTMHLACTKGIEACDSFAQSLAAGTR